MHEGTKKRVHAHGVFKKLQGRQYRWKPSGMAGEIRDRARESRSYKAMGRTLQFSILRDTTSYWRVLNHMN